MTNTNATNAVHLGVATFSNIYGEPMREWSDDYGYGFTLRMWDAERTDRLGKPCVAYTFHDSNFDAHAPVFAGEDFYVSPFTVIDGDSAVASLLSFLSLQPGDTDSGYFDGYTSRQIEWRNARAEALSMCALELSEELEG